GVDFWDMASRELQWLNQMWDPAQTRLYYQVGIGDGNGSSILGDHDVWRLPQADDRLHVKPGMPEYFVKHRPVFFDGGPYSLISPNLAGRMAADWALCFQVFHTANPNFAAKCLRNAELIYGRAKITHVGRLTTAAPYDYYPETEWRDDMELGAAELALALRIKPLPAGLRHARPAYYVSAAIYWAEAYIHGQGDVADTLNLYDVSGLAHFEVHHALAGYSGRQAASARRDVLSDLVRQLSSAEKIGRSDPFGFGLAYNSHEDLTPHALGLSVEAQLYDAATKTERFAAFGRRELNWVLGTNAWGSSFVVGLASTFPHCLQHQVANLSGSLTGRPPVLEGAVVDGPNASSSFAGLGTVTGMNPCPANGTDQFRRFSARSVRYWDNVVAYPSTEPADDYTAPTVPLFADLVAER
ncbi:MAG TPA: glycoside hydrolase family 9 protein, partial [Chloroflexota bacterium]|nr:glycoside hydrolase family 9 protein [Chloroflexota bacterium]